MSKFDESLSQKFAGFWKKLNLTQKLLLKSVPVLLIVVIGVSASMAYRGDMVVLVTSKDWPNILKICHVLDQEGFCFSRPDDRTIVIDNSQKARAAMKLAEAGLLGEETGVCYSVLDRTLRDITFEDRVHDIQIKRAMQNKLEEAIASGASNITNARVHLSTMAGLYQDDSVAPSASVQVVSRGSISKEQVIGIQNLISGAVPKLAPEHVYVFGSNNRLISQSPATAGTDKKPKPLEVKQTIEEDIRRRVEDVISTYFEEDAVDVKVTASIDWAVEKINQIDIRSDSPAPISEKTYTEDTSCSLISGPPGVDSNVQPQDTGIGSQTSVTSTVSETIYNDSPAPLSEKTYEEENSSPSISGLPGVESNVKTQESGIGSQTPVSGTISETMTQYPYPWTKIMKEMPAGELKDISVRIIFPEAVSKELVAAVQDQITSEIPLLERVDVIVVDRNKQLIIKFPYAKTGSASKILKSREGAGS